MNTTKLTLFFKGMNSVSIYQKKFAIALAELQEDTKNYAKEFNLKEDIALNQIMKIKTAGQCSLFFYSIIILLSLFYAVKLQNDFIIWSLVLMLYLPYLVTYLYMKKINNTV